MSLANAKLVTKRMQATRGMTLATRIMPPLFHSASGGRSSQEAPGRRLIRRQLLLLLDINRIWTIHSAQIDIGENYARIVDRFVDCVVRDECSGPGPSWDRYIRLLKIRHAVGHRH